MKKKNKHRGNIDTPTPHIVLARKSCFTSWRINLENSGIYITYIIVWFNLKHIMLKGILN